MNALPLFLCLALAAASVTDRSTNKDESLANPIRKVVTMLQAMQKRIQTEGEKEKELYEKFQCYCKNGRGTLEAAIAAAETKVPAVSSDIEQAESQKAQLAQDLKQHQVDRDAAKSAMAEATALREKEATAFGAEKAEFDANIAAISKAVAALEKGMTGGFLQTESAQSLRKFILAKGDMIEADRQEILSFLSSTQSSEYSPASGEVTGILKQLGDDMSKSLADSTAAENGAKGSYEALISAKLKEVNALTTSIETKTGRIGELAVNIVQMKNDLSDTQQALLEDKKFLADLDSGCDSKAKEWDERSKTRADELVALSETIKILNDDDALELFKKVLPSASASFVQVDAGEAHRVSAIKILADLRDPKIDFIGLALRGRKVGFEKVIKMIDNMVVTLKEEQQNDDHKKEYCAGQFDVADDKKKDLERQSADKETAIANAEEGLAATKDDIAALTAGIKALDKQVAEATEQRKEEHQDFTALMASDAACKDLLNFAKNRLNKFYNRHLYKAPPKRELSEQDRIVVNMGGTMAATAATGIAGTGITVLTQRKDAPAPPPETFGAYSKKSEESTGVIGMIDLLIKDIDKELAESQVEEKNAQSEYETAMSDAAEKRSLDTKSLMGKESTKADLEEALQKHSDDRVATEKELMATGEYIAALHSECDWLLQYFDVRKEAREGEIDSLKNAKAILSGADFAGVQLHKQGSA